MDNTYQTVVQGEAPESDEEEEEISHTRKELPTSVIVEGEASESDEEEIDTSLGVQKTPEIPPLRLSNQSLVDELGTIPPLSVRQMGQPKYNTILHRKLWESNLSLCNNLNGTVCQAYAAAAKDITSCCQHLTRSYAAVQDVSHHMRLMTNDLFKLDDNIDIISTCKLLPDIQLPNPEASSPQPS